MDKWFDDWAIQHATTFGLSEPETKTILSWRERFLTSGYLGEELREATDWLAAHPKCVAADGMIYLGKMTAHLAAIQARIHDQRAIQYQAGPEPEEDQRGTCVLCGNTGRVIVPHLGGIRNGEWMPQKIARAAASYYTHSVLCSCSMGNWVAGRSEFKTAKGDVLHAMTLANYQLRNPRWKVQLEKRRQRQWKLSRMKEEFDSSMRSTREREAWDKLDSVFDRLMELYGIVRGEDGYERKDKTNGQK